MRRRTSRVPGSRARLHRRERWRAGRRM